MFFELKKAILESGLKQTFIAQKIGLDPILLRNRFLILPRIMHTTPSCESFANWTMDFPSVRMRSMFLPQIDRIVSQGGVADPS